VAFDIDANGIMHVSAKDLGTGREQKMTVTGGSALPKEDIDRMMRDAESYAEEDRKRREAVETRNQAEQLVYQTEKFVRENEDRVPADVRTDVESAVTDLKALLDGEADTAALRAGVERLATVSQRVGQAMYQGSGAATTASDAETGPGPAAEPEEGVVDAELVDEDGENGDGGNGGNGGNGAADERRGGGRGTA
jgi:molecular chaperone DnaK